MSEEGMWVGHLVRYSVPDDEVPQVAGEIFDNDKIVALAPEFTLVQ